VTPNLARYERIAPFYDLFDLAFERHRYHALRPLLFQNLKGRLLDAGIGTGRNCAFYPPGTIVSGRSEWAGPAQQAKAERRSEDQWVQGPPGDSLQPEAIGAVMVPELTEAQTLLAALSP
jgi:hypothetical protein